VLHEFSSVTGVREDVTDIVLNLKGVAIRMDVDGPKRLTVQAKGPGAVTAGDISESNGIEILNKDHVICHLDEGASLYMELTVAQGKGYVSADKNKPEDAPIGLIPIDAIFSPVKKVSYDVQPTREGQVLDYDKLTMKIETNGGLTPDDAVAYAARILQDQLSIFLNFEEPESATAGALEDGLEFNPLLLKKVDELELSVPFGNCLKNDNIVYIGDLIQKTEAEMLRRPTSGEVAQRDQGSALGHGPAPRHGGRGLAAGEHRGAGQEVRGPVLSLRAGRGPARTTGPPAPKGERPSRRVAGQSTSERRII
jgi:DNA-directed RNA polymerase subunit alpha